MSIAIVGLGGSLRAGSLASAALRDILALARERGAATELLDLAELRLPVFLPDAGPEAYDAASRPAIERLIGASRRADAFVWASPTYHGSMSGAFKNALDFLDHLRRDDPPYLQGKPVGLMALHEADTLTAMASCVHGLRAWLAPTRVLLQGSDFGPDGTIGSDRARRRMSRLVEELLSFRRAHG